MATFPDDMGQAKENEVESGARGKAEVYGVDRFFREAVPISEEIDKGTEGRVVLQQRFPSGERCTVEGRGGVCGPDVVDE